MILRDAEKTIRGLLRGALFETFIIAELMKSRFNQGESPELYFWRDSNGNELDVIAEHGGKLMPLEIKSGKTLSKESTSGLKKWLSLTKDQSTSPTLIYGGTDSYKYNDIKITGWQQSGDILKKLLNQ